MSDRPPPTTEEMASADAFEQCEIVDRSAGPLRWRFAAVTPDGREIATSGTFVSRLLTPLPGNRSQRELDQLVATLALDGWHVVRQAGADSRQSRRDWWATYLVRGS